ncbi:hypothetical protein HY230_12025, partial [Candidatus Acetothermia bacterium]|nr:hypothetical protein [Candidatus Acetothermia bacterium]
VRPPTGLVDAPGFVAVVDTQTWKVVRNVSVRDSSPIWVSFTADGKNAYVSGGHESLVIKLNIDGAPSRWSVVGMSRAGVEGPYGINLNWDETQIWTHGKGEGSHNLGITMGLTNPKLMVNPVSATQAVGEYYTACLRNDHGAVNPDPKLNELWLSCNSSFEIVVFDMAKKEVKARIPLPNGGSTHSGSFVRYNVDDMGNWTGEVQSDQNGLQGSALAEKKKILGIK